MFQDGENRKCQTNMKMTHLEGRLPYAHRSTAPPKEYSLGQVYSEGHPGMYRRGAEAENRPKKKAAPVLIRISSYCCRGMDICSAKRLSGTKWCDTLQSLCSVPIMLKDLTPPDQ